VLFYRGELPPPAWPLVAVVGTRQPTGHGRNTACGFGFELARCGIPTVSGLARGIDLAAHRGSLAGWRGERCATVAVLGCGIDRIYPYSSREVAREVVRRGCLVSEFPPGAAAYPHHFPLRNRIIAGFSRAVLVVEAPARSGALITAACAADEGREVLVSADVLGSSRAAGCAALAAAGAPPVDGAGALLAEVGLTAPGAPPPAAAPVRCEVPRHQRAAGAWLAGRFALERERQIVVNDWSIEDRM
jgi:DNA processing protein